MGRVIPKVYLQVPCVPSFKAVDVGCGAGLYLQPTLIHKRSFATGGFSAKVSLITSWCCLAWSPRDNTILLFK